MGRINHTETIAKRVDASRCSLDIAVNRLAEASGIPRTTLQRKLKGAAEFTGGELIVLGDQMNVNPEVWIQGLAKAAQ